MVRDRYEPVALFALMSTGSVVTKPAFAQLDRLLDDDVRLQQIKAELLHRVPFTATHGRPSIPVDVILRMLVVRRLYPWSDEETAHCVADSPVLRQFCRIDGGPVPDDTTLLRWAM
jgi:IS5 family transposase